MDGRLTRVPARTAGDWAVAVLPLAALLVAGLLVAAGWSLLAAAPAAARSAVELPVSFRVTNANTTSVPCPLPNDGGSYTVRGHVTVPRGALAAKGPRAITVYLTGFDTGEWNWRFRAVRGYDWPARMARRGQASLTLDMLGYGASGRPQGNAVCIGSQAAVTHQIIASLRKGDYRLGGRRAAVRFRRVVLAGHDVG